MDREEGCEVDFTFLLTKSVLRDNMKLASQEVGFMSVGGSA